MRLALTTRIKQGTTSHVLPVKLRFDRQKTSSLGGEVESGGKIIGEAEHRGVTCQACIDCLKRAEESLLQVGRLGGSWFPASWG